MDPEITEGGEDAGSAVAEVNAQDDGGSPVAATPASQRPIQPPKSAPAKSAKVVPIKGRGETAPAATDPQVTDGGISEEPPLDEVLQQLLDEEEGIARQKQTPDEDKLPEGVDPNSKAGNRWQDLANKRREAEQRATQSEQQLTQATQYVQQVQQWAQSQVAQVQQQMAEMRGQMQAFQQQRPQEPQDEATRLRQEWLSGMKSELEAASAPALKRAEAAEQRVAKLEKFFEDQKREGLSQQYQTQALQAVRNVTLRGMPEDLAGKMGPQLVGQVLATALHMNVSMEQAANIVRSTHMHFGLGLVRANSAKLRESLKKAKEQAPTAPGTRRGNAQGNAIPGIKDLHNAGYVDELDYLQRNG